MEKYEKTPTGLFKIEYKEIKRTRIYSREEFIRWFENKVMPMLEYERIRNPHMILSKLIADYLEGKGFLPKEIEKEA